MKKTFSPSCERNQQFILDVLKNIIKPTYKNLLEIGTGTGQHAVFMASSFPHLLWHTTDLKENHAGINMWIKDSNLKNISEPIEYESGRTDFPQVRADVVFTTNTLHIMSWKNVQMLINQFGNNLSHGVDIIIYGPFNYEGKFISESNANFDLWLKQQNPHSGIRDFELLDSLMNKVGIKLINDYCLPANNRILHYQKYV